jgi:hypothetical protein
VGAARVVSDKSPSPRTHGRMAPVAVTALGTGRQPRGLAVHPHGRIPRGTPDFRTSAPGGTPAAPPARDGRFAAAYSERVATFVVGLPACPRTHVHRTSCFPTSARSSSQRSWLSTGSPSTLRHPRHCQPSSQSSLKARTTYCESPSTDTRQLSFRHRSPSIAARNSIRLLVVCLSLPKNSLSVPLYTRIAAQPPGPGFPQHDPSM